MEALFSTSVGWTTPADIELEDEEEIIFLA
jgi:hypothetical protein